MHLCWNNKIYQSVKRKNSLISRLKVIWAVFFFVFRVQNDSCWNQQKVKEISVPHRSRCRIPPRRQGNVPQTTNSHEIKGLLYVCMQIAIQELISFFFFLQSCAHQTWRRCPKKKEQRMFEAFGSTLFVISSLDKQILRVLVKRKSCQATTAGLFH